MQKMRLLLLFLFTALGCFAQTVQQKLNEYFIASQQTSMFNGSVLITKNGVPLLKQGYGYKDFEAKLPADENTIYQIGSVTKQFTSTIILQLAEQKKLSLSNKIDKYFPSLPYGDKVSIENLLTHTSGIWNYTNDEKFMQTAVFSPKTEQEMLALFKDKHLEFEPGTKHSYSNSGYILLGYIIQKVTGKPYEKVVRERIFDPLNMTHSGFDFVHLQSPDKAVGYSIMKQSAAQRSPVVDSTVSFAAGAMYTTVGDLNKWNESLATQKILKTASLQNAFTPRLDHYALGWAIDSIAGKRILTHGGGIHGFLSSNSYVPADDVSVSFISNSNSSKMDRISKDVLAILYDQPYTLPEVPKEISIDTAILKQYVGKYELAPQFSITVTSSNGKLYGQATGQPAFELFASGKDKFFLKVVDAQVDFLRNNKGEVDQMILHQNGRDLPGKKVE